MKAFRRWCMTSIAASAPWHILSATSWQHSGSYLSCEREKLKLGTAVELADAKVLVLFMINIQTNNKQNGLTDKKITLNFSSICTEYFVFQETPVFWYVCLQFSVTNYPVFWFLLYQKQKYRKTVAKDCFCNL